MSFLPGRLAATENAFFREQSKAAARLLRDKMGPEKVASPAPSPTKTSPVRADTLPEILRHTLPKAPPVSAPRSAAKRPRSPVTESSSLAGVSIMKQVVTDADGPQLGLHRRVGNDPVELLSTSIPSQTTFGPRRWIVDHTPGLQPVPSTANAARLYAGPLDPPTEAEVKAGMLQVANAFGVATALVFGGGAAVIGYASHRLGWNSLEDVKTKSREALLPKVETMREWFKPTQQWALQIGGKWKMEDVERKTIGAEFARALGVQDPVKQIKRKRNADQATGQQEA